MINQVTQNINKQFSGILIFENEFKKLPYQIFSFYESLFVFDYIEKDLTDSNSKKKFIVFPNEDKISKEEYYEILDNLISKYNIETIPNYKIEDIAIYEK